MSGATPPLRSTPFLVRLLKYTTNELVKMKIINKEDVLDPHLERVKKAYPAYFDTYENMDELIAYLNTFNNYTHTHSQNNTHA